MLMSLLDDEGARKRKQHRLVRRVYQNKVRSTIDNGYPLLVKCIGMSAYIAVTLLATLLCIGSRLCLAY